MNDHPFTPPLLPLDVAHEVNQALDGLERAMQHIEEEELIKSAMEVGIAIGRLQSLIERKLSHA